MKTLSRFFLIASAICCASAVSAQKYGIINTQELIQVMPEMDSVQIKMNIFAKEMEEQLEEIQVEFNQKYESYNKNMASYSEATRQLKEKELQDIQNRYESFRQTAQLEMQRKQQELMTPVVTRAENAIKKVSKDGGFLIVFDDSVGSTVYTDESQVINILPQVKKELGIPENAKPREMPQ